MNMLEIRGVSKAYRDVAALRGIDLDIAPGEIVGLLGSNGAGKSTLISIVAGLIDPDAGTVRIGDVDVRSNRLRARGLLGIAPQELGIYLPLTVATNLRFFGKLAGLTRSQLTDRVEAVAAALDLSHLLNRRAQELSGGEKRRLHTGAALLHGARLLLLDEPTAGVDITTRNRLLALVRELASEGAAVCYATHYLPEVEALNASVAILEGGRFIARGTVTELTTDFNDTIVEIRLHGKIPSDINVEGGSMMTFPCCGSTLTIQAPQCLTRSTRWVMQPAESSRLTLFSQASRAPILRLQGIDLLVPIKGMLNDWDRARLGYRPQRLSVAGKGTPFRHSTHSYASRNHGGCEAHLRCGIAPRGLPVREWLRASSSGDGSDVRLLYGDLWKPSVLP